MREDSHAAGRKAGNASGFSDDTGDYGGMDIEQAAMMQRGEEIYHEAYKAAYRKSMMNDLLTGMGNIQKVITDETMKAYHEGYQDGKAAAKSKATF